MPEEKKQTLLVGPMGHVNVPAEKAAGLIASGDYQTPEAYVAAQKPKAKKDPPPEPPKAEAAHTLEKE